MFDKLLSIVLYYVSLFSDAPELFDVDSEIYSDSEVESDVK